MLIRNLHVKSSKIKQLSLLYILYLFLKGKGGGSFSAKLNIGHMLIHRAPYLHPSRLLHAPSSSSSSSPSIPHCYTPRTSPPRTAYINSNQIMLAIYLCYFFLFSILFPRHMYRYKDTKRYQG